MSHHTRLKCPTIIFNYPLDTSLGSPSAVQIHTVNRETIFVPTLASSSCFLNYHLVCCHHHAMTQAQKSWCHSLLPGPIADFYWLFLPCGTYLCLFYCWHQLKWFWAFPTGSFSYSFLLDLSSIWTPLWSFWDFFLMSTVECHTFTQSSWSVWLKVFSSYPELMKILSCNFLVEPTC